MVFGERFVYEIIKGSLAGPAFAGILAMIPAAAFAHGGGGHGFGGGFHGGFAGHSSGRAFVKPAWHLRSVGTVDDRILAVHPGHIGLRHRLFGM